MQNGRCGYVLMPECMFDPGFNPMDVSTHTNSRPVTLSIQVRVIFIATHTVHAVQHVHVLYCACIGRERGKERERERDVHTHIYDLFVHVQCTHQHVHVHVRVPTRDN